MTSKTVAFFLGLTCAASPALALSDIAPTPQKSPKPPVARQVIVAQKEAIPSSRTVDGVPKILDLERIHIGDYDLRLFGIVPPQLSASYGPQARAELDKIVQGGSVSCQIRDRSKDGRLLATCKTASGIDLALDLLKKGLAVTARGSLAETDVAAAYVAAEQAAQSQKVALWSGIPAAPVQVIATPPAKPEVEASKDDVTSTSAEPDKKEASTTADEIAKAMPPMLVTELMAASAVAQQEAGMTASAVDPVPELSFWERFQLLLAGGCLSLSVLIVGGGFLFQRHRERKGEVGAIAAALRGELMAARAICLSRLQQMAGNVDAAASVAWPRLRTVVFQAYVGRIGTLGAEMARQISSIYGLASDYASYYGGAPQNAAKTDFMSKQHAMQKLVDHIETVLPRLMAAEYRRPILAFSRKRGMGSLPPGGKKPLAPASSASAIASSGNAMMASSEASKSPVALIEEIILKHAEENKPLKKTVESAKAEESKTESGKIEIVKSEPIEEPKKESAKTEFVKPEVIKPEDMKAENIKKETYTAKKEAAIETKTGSSSTEEIVPVLDKSIFTEKMESAEKKQEADISGMRISEKTIAPQFKDGKTPVVARHSKEDLKARAAKAIIPMTLEAWAFARARLAEIRDSLHEKFASPAYDPTQLDNDEYLAMLNAEQELFASFDLADKEAAAKRKKRG